MGLAIGVLDIFVKPWAWRRAGTQCLVSMVPHGKETAGRGAGHTLKPLVIGPTCKGIPGRGRVVSRAWRRTAQGACAVWGEGLTLLARSEWLKTQGSRIEGRKSAEGWEPRGPSVGIQ